MNYKTIISVLAIILFSMESFAQETKEVNVNTFNEIRLEGSAHWILIPSENEKVIIESKNAEVFNYIKVENKGQALVISTTEKAKNITKLFRSVTIKVYFSSVNSISLGGVGSVTMDNVTTTNELETTLRGTGSMNLNINCTDFIGNIYGTGSLSIKGAATNSTIRVEGVGNFEGYDFTTVVTKVTVSGVGGAQVYAAKTLTATINGVGSIRYKGDPKNKNFNSNGLGSIKKAKD